MVTDLESQITYLKNEHAEEVSWLKSKADKAKQEAARDTEARVEHMRQHLMEMYNKALEDTRRQHAAEMGSLEGEMEGVVTRSLARGGSRRESGSTATTSFMSHMGAPAPATTGAGGSGAGGGLSGMPPRGPDSVGGSFSTIGGGPSFYSTAGAGAGSASMAPAGDGETGSGGAALDAASAKARSRLAKKLKKKKKRTKASTSRY